MRAVICTGYGPPEVLQLRDMPKPAPKRDQILIKIHTAAVTTSDIWVRTALRSAPAYMQLLIRLVIGFTKPRKPILGFVLAGEIEAVGRGATKFKGGDRVCAFTMLQFGAYAEYIALNQNAVAAVLPASLTYDEAATIPYGGLIGLHYLRKGNIASGQHVLIYGASGAIGTSAIQLAKHFGAQVTAVCGSANGSLALSLGADSVIDYQTQHALPHGARFDLVLDAVGKRKTSALKTACAKALAPGGIYVSVDDGSPKLSAAGLAMLMQLVESGALKPVIDRSFSLEEIVDAHRYVELGHKRGNVVLTVAR